MKNIPIKKEEISKNIKDFKYYIVYYFDRLIFGEGDIEAELDIENINEAFFFDEDKCMHIYREDGLKGIKFLYESNDKILPPEEQIAKKGKEFNNLKSLIVKKFINYDEDGQAYIERVFPAKLIFK